MDPIVCLDSAETLIDGVSALLIELSVSGGALPTEIRMFGLGVTDTTKGKFLFDAYSAEQVMSKFKASGKDRLPFDFDHGMVSYGGDGRAAGWYVPEVRAGELWATDIQWTPRAARELGDREWRFYSPAFRAHYSDEPDQPAIIIELINCALTNLPATKGQRPIIASETDRHERTTMNPILKLLGVAGETEAHTAVTQLLSLQASVAALLKANNVETIAELGSLIVTSQKAVKDMTDERSKEKRAARIAKLSEDGRLPPAQHEFAASLSDDHFARFEASLPESATPSPAVTPLSSGSTPRARPSVPAQAALTPEEIELANMFGQDTGEMLNVKNELINSDNPRRFTPRVKKSA